ncbi:uncharacterized protein LOC109710327 [Ananas comosus]|uniref:Uncharacterized protein LOC109710327 n=1 Tax=Ananas comosus TaxID=4615 RepID=A0A6P5EY42_ANACO|nr:uncharacterized protein LOC109710327 [Ananas comosus]
MANPRPAGLFLPQKFFPKPFFFFTISLPQFPSLLLIPIPLLSVSLSRSPTLLCHSLYLSLSSPLISILNSFTLILSSTYYHHLQSQLILNWISTEARLDQEGQLRAHHHPQFSLTLIEVIHRVAKLSPGYYNLILHYLHRHPQFLRTPRPSHWGHQNPNLRVAIECGVRRVVYTGSAAVAFDGSRDVVLGDGSMPYPDKYADVLDEPRVQVEMMVLDANWRGGICTYLVFFLECQILWVMVVFFGVCGPLHWIVAFVCDVLFECKCLLIFLVNILLLSYYL